MLQDRPALPSGKTPHDISTADTLTTAPKSGHESQRGSIPRRTDWLTVSRKVTQIQSHSLLLSASVFPTEPAEREYRSSLFEMFLILSDFCLNLEKGVQSGNTFQNKVILF